MANLLLPNLEDVTINAGVIHILRHSSVAIKRFNGRFKGRINHYGKKIGVKYNQWQEDLAQYKAITDTEMMTHKDLGRGTSVEQMIDLTAHGCVSDMFSEDIMKRAMATADSLAEFIADKIEIALSRAAYSIDIKFIDDICKLENYHKGDDVGNSKAIFKNPVTFYLPGITEETTGMYEKDGDNQKVNTETLVKNNLRQLLTSVNATCASMNWPSKNFNQLELVSSNMSKKRTGLILSEEVDANAEDYYGHVFNANYADLSNKYAWVEVLPIGGDRKRNIIALNALDGYVLDIDENSGTGFDNSRQAFREYWFYKWIDAFQDVAKGTNMACWITE